uniref:Uncharacterized protein n=1 Tax=Rhizophora mucronata TaxID=61149 RepID=A0A2P2PXS4_RHIMU
MRIMLFHSLLFYSLDELPEMGLCIVLHIDGS